MTRALRYLHLSDLHLGCPGQARWWQVEEDFQCSLVATMARIGGPPDLVLISGDLTDAGTPAQFEQLDAFLDKLATWLGPTFVIPVPGNHDVARPDTRSARKYSFLNAIAQRDDPTIADLFQQLWTDHDASELAPLFAPYTTWRARRFTAQQHRDITVHLSHFPGDLAVTVALPGVAPALIVGLNSAWQQYRDNDYHGRLELPIEQFHAALGGPPNDPLAPLRADGHNLLLMHHAPTWLSEPARAAFLADIYPPHRFAAALFGHLHGRARCEASALCGGQARHVFHAASLFGRETDRDGQPRMLGHAWGTLATDGELRLWPLSRVPRGGGVQPFVPDRFFELGSDHSFPLRTGTRPGIVQHPPPPADALGLACYLTRIARETSHIELDGLARADEAARYPIEDMYVRLVARTLHDEHPAALHTAMHRGGSTVDLADLLPDHPRLLIVGDPGAGKTTFLRLVAHALHDALLDKPGASASREVRGLARDGRVPLPIFAKIAEVMDRTAASSLARRSLLLHHLADLTCPEDQRRTSGEPDPGADARRAAWDARLRQGDAVLLLDGLDEVADPEQRRRVFAMLDDALEAWPDCPVLVTSRPFSHEPLQRRHFIKFDVAPFDTPQIRTYVEHWVAALYAEPSARPMPQRDYADGLFAALRDRPEIRRLAANPVMLTCLCVVHWHGKGRLPEGRAEVYRVVLRWLLAARDEARREHMNASGLDSIPIEMIEEAFSILALAMMRAPGGKKVIVDLAWAAAQVDPVVGRYFRTDDPPGRARQIETWLRFECERSGVIQEVGDSQLKFWHLTFQEYLAAQRLTRTDDPWAELRKHVRDGQWRETIDMYPACLLVTGVEHVDALMKRVLEPRGKVTLARAAEITALAGRLLTTLQAHSYKLPEVQAPKYHALRTRALEIFTPPGAAQVDEKTRIAAAEALGRVGDERISPNAFRANLLPVPGTEILLGKYLVTIDEFARFVADDGYTRRDLWDEEGWAFRERHGWTEPGEWADHHMFPNQPVAYVSWFEATAYCRWRSEPGLAVRLPTRVEWLAAASPDGRRHPWGNISGSEEKLANCGNRVGRPTPVGIYPAGNGECGHCDLAGNVWEWSADANPDIKTTDEDREKYGLPIFLCGGTFFIEMAKLEAMSRHWLRSWHRDISRGFRVAAVPSQR